MSANFALRLSSFGICCFDIVSFETFCSSSFSYFSLAKIFISFCATGKRFLA